MSRTGAEIRASESQNKFIQERVNKVEKHFGEFCDHIAAFNRKLSKLRDKGDEISTSIMTYAENESHNPTTKQGLRQFSENFSAVQDYRDTEVRRIEDRVIAPLTKYGASCKAAKERLKFAFNARKKEINQKDKLEKVKEKKPSDRHTISQAESDLQRAGVEAARSNKTLEEEMDSFEKQKLVDIKNILQDFVNIEIIFHAKALEMYTDCYRNLVEINEDEDLEEFRNSLRPTHTSSRLELQRAHSKTSLNSTSGLNGTSTHSRGTTPAAARKTPHPTTPNTTGKSTMNSEDFGTSTAKSSTMYSDSTEQEETTFVGTMTGTESLTATAASTTFSETTLDEKEEVDEEEDSEEEEEESESEEESDDDEDDEYARRFQSTKSPKQQQLQTPPRQQPQRQHPTAPALHRSPPAHPAPQPRSAQRPPISKR